MPPLWSLVNFLFPISRNNDICKYAKTYLLYTVFHLQELRFCFSFSLYSLSSPWFYFSYDFHRACHANYYIFDHIQDRSRLVVLWVFLLKMSYDKLRDLLILGMYLGLWLRLFDLFDTKVLLLNLFHWLVIILCWQVVFWIHKIFTLKLFWSYVGRFRFISVINEWYISHLQYVVKQSSDHNH